MNIAPHRFLVNNRNVLRDAVLMASSVRPAANSVQEEELPRRGTAQALLAGNYVGPEDATYEVQVTSDVVGSKLVSAPLRSGVGTGTLQDIIASNAAQTYFIELFDAGTLEAKASVDFEGVRLVSRSIPGNNISIIVDQSTLVFNDTIYSLLDALAPAAGGLNTGLEGQGYDWDTKAMDANGIIPLDAHRIAFGDDRTIIYTQYKQYDSTGARWLYHFIPEIKHAVPAGTPVYFVDGGRTVQVLQDDVVVDTFTDVRTVYDFLSQLKTPASTLLDVDGVVAFDRSAVGQASREFLLRTDAHVERSSGTGHGASGFVDAFAAEGALTELVTAECWAVNGKDSPAAHLGAELWTVKGSLSGVVGTATTGVPFAHPDGRWGFTIPRKLPEGYGLAKGRFTANPPNYITRPDNATPPPICVVGMALGPNAVDEQITLRWSRRPTGDCTCQDMLVFPIDGNCLGVYNLGGSMLDAYSEDNRERLEDLYEWQGNVIRQRSSYTSNGYALQSPFVANPVSTKYGDPNVSGNQVLVDMFFTKTLFEIVADWEKTLKDLNDLSLGSPEGVLRAQAEALWDVRVAEFKSDVTGGTSRFGEFPVYEDLTAGDAVSIFVDNDGVEKVRKAVSGEIKYGFVIADAAAGSPVTTVYYFGTNTVASGAFEVGTTYAPSRTVPGGWTADPTDRVDAPEGMALPTLTATATSATMLTVVNPLLTNYNNVYYALLADRYKSRMQEVLITGGISPLGKAEASTLESGDGCWRDWGGTHWWTVNGPDRGYGPAFNNKPYISVRKADDESKYFSTKEFAFQVNVACPDKLVEGDEIVLSIGDSGWPPTYTVGDVNTLPVVAAAPFRLSGGRVGDPIQSWYVNGSIDGALDVFLFDPTTDVPSVYAGDGLAFAMKRGGIPFIKGDKFKVVVEGGAWRWRKAIDGVFGGWSSEADITADPVLLDDGLSLSFVTGAAPSFVADDTFRFIAFQPRAVSNVRVPTTERWAWADDDPAVTLDVDIGANEPISSASIALHSLPVGAVVTLEGGAAPGVFDWSQEFVRRDGAMVIEFPQETARYLRYTISGVTAGGSIGWMWAGVPFTTAMGLQSIRLSHQYKIERGNVGLSQGGVFSGYAVGGTAVWSEGTLTKVEAGQLIDMVNWIKRHQDESFLFVPQITIPAEVLMAQVLDDELPIDDLYEYGLNANREPMVDSRRFSATLNLKGTWQQ